MMLKMLKANAYDNVDSANAAPHFFINTKPMIESNESTSIMKLLKSAMSPRIVTSARLKTALNSIRVSRT